MYFEEQDRVGVEQNIDLMTSSGGGSCQLQDHRRHHHAGADSSGSKYHYNLEDSQSDEEIRSYVHAHRTFNGHGSQTRLQYDSVLIMPFDLPSQPIKEKCDTCGDARQGVMAARRCTTAGVSKADWKHKTTCGDAFTVVNCSDYRAWSASRT
jgi:hypothetical protein